MLIQQRDDNNTGSFFINEDGELLAELRYHRSGEKQFTIDHTEVNEKLAGKGVGKQLVHAAVEYARSNHLKIAATCSFSRKVLEKTAEYNDVYMK